eukprot:5435720-Pleurochrysis_carterae.AAC.1
MRQESFQGKAKNCHHSRHVSFYSTIKCMRGEYSQSERDMRVPHCRKSNLRRAAARTKSGGRQPRGKAESQEGGKHRGGATPGEESNEGVAF